jgi:hypothetical protein
MVFSLRCALVGFVVGVIKRQGDCGKYGEYNQDGAKAAPEGVA